MRRANLSPCFGHGIIISSTVPKSSFLTGRAARLERATSTGNELNNPWG